MERRAIAVQGIVQGVGFRPFVYGLASRLQLGGFVSNNGGAVQIEIEGPPQRLDEFLCDLTVRPPPLARIENVNWRRLPPLGDCEFHIGASTVDSHNQVLISPDVATCDQCLAELFDPNDRRYRYPFLNCTNCGPRLTIITSAPYDRQRTTMAGFEMCADCRAEYEDPSNRRFHAQPTACPVCGPHLAAVDAAGKTVDVPDPLSWFADAVRNGRIGAIKGLGGYHLVCDARNETAVRELRRRKHRDEKPFAVMVRDVAAAEVLCEIGPAECALLTSSRRPIVLLRKRRDIGLSDRIAPGNPMLGVMLPYTPLHHLLMREINTPLVMTSGNRSDEPIATTEPEVFERLSGIADLYLTHNRPIHVRCDDAVTRVIDGVESPIRRSRGYAPQPIRLSIILGAPILAVGGQLKGTFALGNDRQAIISHHLGDLDHFEAFRAFERDVALFEQLFAMRPKCIAHDLHPDYASTRYAQRRAAEEGVALVPVQHHHAHMASCMAEHGIDEPVIGVSFDGTGYGTDGAIWGGEFLIGDFASFTRAAHLRYVPMPGGERAVKEPWRMAAAHLKDAGVEYPQLSSRIDPQALHTIETMLAKRFNAPLTSSAGRLFDAVASLMGIRDRVSFEGQAAMELEWLAGGSSGENPYPFVIDEAMELDTRPMIRAIAGDVAAAVNPAEIARRFHATLSAMIVQTCIKLRENTGISKVVLSGGVFMNSLLSSDVKTKLESAKFCPLQHCRVPPNDGGLSLGQLCVAARQNGERSCA